MIGKGEVEIFHAGGGWNVSTLRSLFVGQPCNSNSEYAVVRFQEFRPSERLHPSAGSHAGAVDAFQTRSLLDHQMTTGECICCLSDISTKLATSSTNESFVLLSFFPSLRFGLSNKIYERREWMHHVYARILVNCALSGLGVGRKRLAIKKKITRKIGSHLPFFTTFGSKLAGTLKRFYDPLPSNIQGLMGRCAYGDASGPDPVKRIPTSLRLGGNMTSFSTFVGLPQAKVIFGFFGGNFTTFLRESET